MNARLHRHFERARSRGARCCTAVVAVGVEMLLRLGSLPRTCRILGIELGPSKPASGQTPSLAQDRAARVHRDVEWVYCRLGLPDSCLRRSLTAGFRLRAHRPQLVIGVKKGETLDAHAWILADGLIIDWAKKHGQYAPMR